MISPHRTLELFDAFCDSRQEEVQRQKTTEGIWGPNPVQI